MARIEIHLPETYRFQTEISVRVTDLNYGNHVGNDRILAIMHEARLQYYRSLGFRDELSFEGSVGHVVSDAAVAYKSEAFMGDVLVCSIATRDFSRYGFDMVYLIINKVTGREVARGKTGIVCFDYEKRKVAIVPEVLLKKLGADEPR